MSSISFAAVGDLMLGDHPVCFGHGVRSAIRKNGYSNIIKDIAGPLGENDLVFGNLECVLSDIGNDEEKIKKSELRGDPASIELLRTCGFNMVSVANNHMLQHGSEAFHDTVNRLSEHKISSVGLYVDGYSNVVKYEKDAIKLVVIGFSLRPEYFFQDNRFYASANNDGILSQVDRLKRELPNYSIIVSLHWGEEYLHTPSKRQIKFAHQLIDHGVSLILGHHPHVLQGFERRGNGLIAYSLGNLIFDSWQKPTRESAILRCFFNENGLDSYEIIPVKIEENYVVSICRDDEAAVISNKINTYSESASKMEGLASIGESDYQAVAAKAYFKYRMQCYLYFVSHIWKYKPGVVFGSIFRAVLRRLKLA